MEHGLATNGPRCIPQPYIVVGPAIPAVRHSTLVYRQFSCTEIDVTRGSTDRVRVSNGSEVKRLRIVTATVITSAISAISATATLWRVGIRTNTRRWCRWRAAIRRTFALRREHIHINDICAAKSVQICELQDPADEARVRVDLLKVTKCLSLVGIQPC